MEEEKKKFTIKKKYEKIPAELFEKMVKAIETGAKHIEESTERLEKEIKERENTLEIFRKEVTQFGNSGHIAMAKKYVGNEAEIRIFKKPTKALFPKTKSKKEEVKEEK